MLRRTQPSRAALPRRSRSTRHLGLVVAWQIVLVVAVALALRMQIWSISLAALMLLAALLLTIPVNGRTLGRTVRTRRRFASRARHRLEHPDVAAELVPLAQWLPKLEVTEIKDAHDGEIGVVADGESWSGILEVTSDNSLFTDRGARLDLAVLGSLTRQDDVVFSGIQIVTYTVPGPPAPCFRRTRPPSTPTARSPGAPPRPPSAAPGSRCGSTRASASRPSTGAVRARSACSPHCASASTAPRRRSSATACPPNRSTRSASPTSSRWPPAPRTSPRRSAAARRGNTGPATRSSIRPEGSAASTTPQRPLPGPARRGGAVARDVRRHLADRLAG
nr:hypothetical protein [Tessaracoccus coleopterorum]